MSETLMPFIWVVIAFGILLLMQRWIHTHLHGVSMLITRRAEWAVIMYSLILLPGVFLHEASHWLTATFLGVRTGSFSLIPRRQGDGSIVLGYVEYYKGRTLGPIRESLIGGAPLIAGTAVILLIGFKIFGVTDLALAINSGEIDNLSAALGQVFATNDILVWLYLLFAISNAMMPSASDRKAWPTFGLILAALLTLFYFIDFRDIILDSLSEWATLIFVNLALAFTLTIVADLLFILLIALFEWVVSSVRGQSVDYS